MITKVCLGVQSGDIVSSTRTVQRRKSEKNPYIIFEAFTDGETIQRKYPIVISQKGVCSVSHTELVQSRKKENKCVDAIDMDYQEPILCATKPR